MGQEIQERSSGIKAAEIGQAMQRMFEDAYSGSGGSDGSETGKTDGNEKTGEKTGKNSEILEIPRLHGYDGQ